MAASVDVMAGGVQVVRWEYLTLTWQPTAVYLNGQNAPGLVGQPLAAILAALGGEGWEAVSHCTHEGWSVLFKRSVASAA